MDKQKYINDFCRVYQRQCQNKLWSNQDIQFDENAYWDWENGEVRRSMKSEQQQDTNDDEIQIAEFDSPVLKTKSLTEIYEKCNFVVHRPSCFEEVSMQKEWNDAMKEELMEC